MIRRNDDPHLFPHIFYSRLIMAVTNLFIAVGAFLNILVYCLVTTNFDQGIVVMKCFNLATGAIGLYGTLGYRTWAFLLGFIFQGLGFFPFFLAMGFLIPQFMLFELVKFLSGVVFLNNIHRYEYDGPWETHQHTLTFEDFVSLSRKMVLFMNSILLVTGIVIAEDLYRTKTHASISNWMDDPDIRHIFMLLPFNVVGIYGALNQNGWALAFAACKFFQKLLEHIAAAESFNSSVTTFSFCAHVVLIVEGVCLKSEKRRPPPAVTLTNPEDQVSTLKRD